MVPNTFSEDSANILNYVVTIKGVGKILALPFWPYIHMPAMELKVNISCRYTLCLFQLPEGTQ